MIRPSAKSGILGTRRRRGQARRRRVSFNTGVTTYFEFENILGAIIHPSLTTTSSLIHNPSSQQQKSPSESKP
ncbi:hypothetical protein HanIR_Chr14g0713931 [Helianthus annuus]|nr:hypothetical protein HanIR_Chr14g0713931 [Helianthus annuus]